jgi:hypothetical protein
MSTETELAISTCTCGRSFAHCRECGSRNVYVKKFKSLELRATVFGCRRCGSETTEGVDCKASPFSLVSTSYTPYQRPREAMPWDGLTEGSEQYAKALIEWIEETSNKKNISIVKAIVEAKKYGWKPELYPMDDEVREALQVSPAEEPKKKYDRLLEKDLVGETKTLDPVPLEEIIRRMGEESK